MGKKILPLDGLLEERWRWRGWRGTDGGGGGKYL
jgi:hypothetical protein